MAKRTREYINHSLHLQGKHSFQGRRLCITVEIESDQKAIAVSRSVGFSVWINAVSAMCDVFFFLKKQDFDWINRELLGLPHHSF